MPANVGGPNEECESGGGNRRQAHDDGQHGQAPVLARWKTQEDAADLSTPAGAGIMTLGALDCI
jgi:hypothetical protein